jgi:hypothetical protein
MHLPIFWCDGKSSFLHSRIWGRIGKLNKALNFLNRDGNRATNCCWNWTTDKKTNSQWQQINNSYQPIKNRPAACLIDGVDAWPAKRPMRPQLNQKQRTTSLSVAIFNLRAIPQADERSPIGTRAPGRRDQGRGSNRRGGTSPFIGRSANGSGRLEPELPNKSIHRSLSRHGNGSPRLAGPPHRTPPSRFSLFRPFLKWWDGAQIRVPASSSFWDLRPEVPIMPSCARVCGSWRRSGRREPPRGCSTPSRSRRLTSILTVGTSFSPPLTRWLFVVMFS